MWRKYIIPLNRSSRGAGVLEIEKKYRLWYCQRVPAGWHRAVLADVVVVPPQVPVHVDAVPNSDFE